MNETIKTLLSRRSYRGYKPEQISKEELSAILECGLRAPSAMNAQNWHFTVIQNKDFLDRINADIREVLPQEAKERMTARNGGDKNFSVFYNAPTVIMVSAVKDDRYSLINCCLAAQNMCLAAESLNIGSCFIGMAAAVFSTPKRDAYIKELGIPESYSPEYALIFGYKGMEMEKPQLMENRVNFME